MRGQGVEFGCGWFRGATGELGLHLCAGTKLLRHASPGIHHAKGERGFEVIDAMQEVTRCGNVPDNV